MDNADTPKTVPARDDELALFQVDGQQPVSLAHLERVNPDLSAEDRIAIRALQVGKSITLSHEESTVRVRRTR